MWVLMKVEMVAGVGLKMGGGGGDDEGEERPSCVNHYYINGE